MGAIEIDLVLAIMVRLETLAVLEILSKNYCATKLSALSRLLGVHGPPVQKLAMVEAKIG